VRTAETADTSTGHEYKIAGKRILFHHMNDLLDALEIHEGGDTHRETAVVVERSGRAVAGQQPGSARKLNPARPNRSSSSSTARTV